MFARNLMAALIVVLFGSMALSCFTATATDVVVAQTALPLEASARTVAVQNVVTDLAAKVNMVTVVPSYIAAN
jgi:hypothetical protein